MRKLIFYAQGRLICCIILIAVFTSCKKGLTIITISPTKITSSTASVGGEVKKNSNYRIDEIGICYGTIPGPTEDASQRIENGKGPGSFKTTLTGLSANTTYYVRTFVICHLMGDPPGTIETQYGDEISFKTALVTLASVSTTKKSEEEYGGYVLNNGGSSITEQGICYGTSHQPTIEDNKLVAHYPDKNGVFTLEPNFKTGNIYYVRAYASNNAGTAYGKELIAGIAGFICAGNKWNGAASYDPSKKGIHPIMSNFSNSYPGQWLSPTIEQAELLICMTKRSVYYKTCYYTGNIQIRQHYDEEAYTVREITTGKIIAKMTFQGKKDDCSETIQYDSKAPTGEWTWTNAVDKNQVEAWIKSFVVK